MSYSASEMAGNLPGTIPKRIDRPGMSSASCKLSKRQQPQHSDNGDDRRKRREDDRAHHNGGNGQSRDCAFRYRIHLSLPPIRLSRMENASSALSKSSLPKSGQSTSVK